MNVNSSLIKHTPLKSCFANVTSSVQPLLEALCSLSKDCSRGGQMTPMLSATALVITGSSVLTIAAGMRWQNSLSRGSMAAMQLAWAGGCNILQSSYVLKPVLCEKNNTFVLQVLAAGVLIIPFIVARGKDSLILWHMIVYDNNFLSKLSTRLCPSWKGGDVNSFLAGHVTIGQVVMVLN